MVIITGASGFIGSQLLKAMKSAARPIFLRDPSWPKALDSHYSSAIVHLAGYPHARGSDQEFWKVNVGRTKELAEEAVRCGVKRFVFISSIQAVAKKPADGETVKTKTLTAPQGLYGRSKLEAEQLLQVLSMESRMEVVVLRAPLVYGPGVKANFRNLFQLVGLGIPLPLSVLDSNQRSFVGIDNLVDFIVTCLDHPAAANETFMVSDGKDLSTPDLIRRMARSFVQKEFGRELLMDRSEELLHEVANI